MQKKTKLLKPKTPENLITKVNGFSFSSTITISRQQHHHLLNPRTLPWRQRAGENYIEKSFLNTEQPSLPLLYGLRNFFFANDVYSAMWNCHKSVTFFLVVVFSSAQGAVSFVPRQHSVLFFFFVNFFSYKKSGILLFHYTVSVPFLVGWILESFEEALLLSSLGLRCLAAFWRCYYVLLGWRICLCRREL